MASDIKKLLLDIAGSPSGDVPAPVLRLAQLSLFDWMVVARAGLDEPVSQIVRDFALAEGGAPVATLIGGGKGPARAAALANGAASHALDYDDTHFGHVGHLAAAILPAAVAAAEEQGAQTDELLAAFALGAEAACRFGAALGLEHYARGYHQTATSGAVGATVAAGRLYNLSPSQMGHALSLVGTRASGLLSQFGSMGKPFNAGMAASNGVEAAQLARRGFLSCDDGLGGRQGFLEAASDGASLANALTNPPPETFLFAENKYKLHACCHGIHAMIEGMGEALTGQNLGADDIERVDVLVNPRWLSVCDLKAPRTGLEVKFSFAWLAGMILHGIDTAAPDAYSDDAARDPRLIEFEKRVVVTGRDEIADAQTTGAILLKSGAAREFAHDLDDPLPLETLERRLQGKAETLIGKDSAERIWSAATRRGDSAGLLSI